ncbi:MAG: hypothetical protein IKR22_07465, partial [Clostridiales bacterium]|nr:hypothetical protein [Clostridiales bacterium]
DDEDETKKTKKTKKTKATTEDDDDDDEPDETTTKKTKATTTEEETTTTEEETTTTTTKSNNSGKTLQDMISDAELKQMNEQAHNMIQSNSEFKDCKIEIIGNELIYEYWFSFELTDAQVDSLKKSASQLESQANTLKGQLEKQYGLDSLQITYVYFDCNDKEVFRAGV